MRALAIVHQPDAGPGVFAEAMHARGVQLDQWMIAEAPAPADPLAYDAVLAFGGAMHPDHEAAHPWLRMEKSLLAAVIRERIPLLGMCLGTQLVAEAAGAGRGDAAGRRRSRHGWAPAALRGVPVAQL
jgi:GMP synthase (glutamine-hydrolysing)